MSAPAPRAAAAVDFATIFAAFPGAMAVFAADPPHFTVLAVSDQLLAAAARTREAIVGRPVAEAFPDRGRAGESDLADLRAALEEVLRTGRSRTMPLQRYDLRGPDGTWQERWWSAHNTPVRDAHGVITCILHQTEDVTDHVRQESALVRAERRAERILEQISDAHVALDDEFRCVRVNAAAERLTGMSRAEMLGRTHWEVFPASVTNEAGDAYRRVVAEGVELHFVQHYVGEGYDVHLEIDAYPTEAGGVAIFWRDITDRVRYHASLEHERARLADVFRQAPVAVAVLRGRVAAELVFELVNPRYEEVIPAGRAPLGRRLCDALPEVVEPMGPVLQRVLDSGEPFVASDYPVPLDRDGDGVPEDYFFSFVYHPLVEPDGSVGGIVGIGTEVTESVRARHDAERARERAERLQALTAALAEARTLEDVANVVVADMVVALGARTGALAGRAPEGDALVLLRTVGFPTPVPSGVSRQPFGLRTPLVECYRTQAPVWIERRDGPDGLDARFPVIAPVWDALGVASALFVPLVAAGETVGVISFAFEGTRRFGEEERAFLLALGRQAALAVERARLFDAEHAARAEAERANQAKSEFLAVMSHELRTPLNAIGGYAELMEMGIRGPVTPPQRADLHRIQQSQRHLLGLINEVLNYARLETGTVHFEITDVRVRDALAGAEALVAPQAQTKGLALVVEHCPPTIAVRADPEKLRQVLVNLLSNAVKFTDRGGRIELGCAVSEDEVRIHVRDTGIGIAANQLGRIFEPFVQVRADLTRTAEGTGLGLAISRDLARGMSGDLTVSSEVGDGSTFTLTLPAATPAAPATTPPTR